jgi:hypothetical protein
VLLKPSHILSNLRVIIIIIWLKDQKGLETYQNELVIEHFKILHVQSHFRGTEVIYSNWTHHIRLQIEQFHPMTEAGPASKTSPFLIIIQRNVQAYVSLWN